jgi:shikimate 5-dehydrogenase
MRTACTYFERVGQTDEDYRRWLVPPPRDLNDLLELIESLSSASLKHSLPWKESSVDLCPTLSKSSLKFSTELIVRAF